MGWSRLDGSLCYGVCGLNIMDPLRSVMAPPQAAAFMASLLAVLKLRGCGYRTKTDGVVRVLRVTPVAESTARAPRAVAPAATAVNAARTRRGTRRITRVTTVSVIVGVIPIITPLPDIPAHIKQTIPIRRKTPHRTRIGHCPVIISRVITRGRANIIDV